MSWYPSAKEIQKEESRLEADQERRRFFRTGVRRHYWQDRAENEAMHQTAIDNLIRKHTLAERKGKPKRKDGYLALEHTVKKLRR